MQATTDPDRNILELLEDKKQLSFICELYTASCEDLRRQLEQLPEPLDPARMQALQAMLEQCKDRLHLHYTELDFCRADLETISNFRQEGKA
jgi:hypothetical protein